MLVANIVKLNDFLQSACRSIADMVSKAGVQDLTGLAGTGENIQGEEQKKLDVISNDVLKNALRYTGTRGSIYPENYICWHLMWW